MKELNIALFKVICLAFSAVLLVLCLLGSVKTAGLSLDIAQLENRIAEAKQENDRLKIQLEQSLSLEQIESFALGELGMQPPAQGQIYHIQLEQEG